MKIAHLTAWYPPHSIGGTEIYVEALAAHLLRAGHEVAVAGPLAGLSAPESATRNGIPVLRYPIPRTPTRDQARGRVRAGSEPLLDWLRTWRPDVVHVHSLTTGLHLPELTAAAANAALVFTAHLPSLTYICQRGTLALWGRGACDGVREPRRCAACALHGRGMPEPLARIAAVMPMPLARRARAWSGRVATTVAMPAMIEELAGSQRDLFALAAAVVVLNTAALNILVSNGAPLDKIVLNRLGISHPPRPKPGPAAAPTRLPICVGYFGRLSREKGIEGFVDAIAMLPADLPMQFSFHGIAHGPIGERLAQRIRALAATRAGVSLHSAIDPSEVPAALAKIDVLCAPSRWFENGPTIALEAIAAGTPVIGTRLGGFTDVITDGVTGRLLEPGDAAALAEVLREVAADPAATIDRWRTNLTAVRTMQDIAADYLDLYQRIVARQPVAVGR